MIGALIIVFKEVIEAGLIVGIVLAATHGALGRARWIWIGIGVGIGGAALLATFAGAVSNAVGGAGQELFNASILGMAVIMLAWHNIWMGATRPRDGAESWEANRNRLAIFRGKLIECKLLAVVGQDVRAVADDERWERLVYDDWRSR
jgi:high-affinity Fe2+/Pb2+ permease